MILNNGTIPPTRLCHPATNRLRPQLSQTRYIAALKLRPTTTLEPQARSLSRLFLGCIAQVDGCEDDEEETSDDETTDDVTAEESDGNAERLKIKLSF